MGKLCTDAFFCLNLKLPCSFPAHPIDHIFKLLHASKSLILPLSLTYRMIIPRLCITPLEAYSILVIIFADRD